MKYLTRFSVFVLLLFKGIDSLGQSNTEQEIRFKGTIQDLTHRRSYSKVMIFSDRNDWFSESDSPIRIEEKIDSNGHFKFNLPNLNKPYKINMVIRNDKNETVSQYLYYVEPKDEITINIFQKQGADSIIFFGNGSEKYRVAYELQNQFHDEYFPKLNSTILKISTDSIQLSQYSDQLYELLKTTKEEKSKLLKNSPIGSGMKIILSHEFGEYDNEWTFRCKLFYDQNPKLRKQIVSIYNSHRMDFYDKPDSLIKYCHLYFFRLASRITLEMMLRYSSDKIDLKPYYDTVKTTYSGILRDRMLGYIFFNKSTGINCIYSPTMMDSLIRDAQMIVTTPYIKKALDIKIGSMDKISNHKVIDSQFIGMDGRRVSIKSLIGKVVLIDTWFNGCFGCAQFHQVFEKDIYPKFKNNKNFVVLSVNIDKDKMRWQAGIAGKLYSSKEYINVSTGNWLEHPFFKYYGIKSSPWLMLIDAKGNVSYQPNGTSTEEMTKKIDEALSNN